MPSDDEIYFPKSELGQKCYADISVALGDKCASYCKHKNWVANFRTGAFCIEGEKLSGRPTQVTIPGNVDVIHSLFLRDRRVSAKMISETLEISRERVGYIINDILDMRNPSA
jgi:hypothetical protein